MSLKTSHLVGPLLTLLAISAPAGAQSGTTACVIHVARPESGQAAGGFVRVEGTAKIPPDHHLWVFARHASFRVTDDWWPQTEGPVDSETGRWRVNAVLGLARDIGDEFDVAVAVFAPEEHRQLVAYLRKARDTTEFHPIEMPAAACVPVLRVIRKTSHDGAG